MEARFGNLVDQVRQVSMEEKEELKFLIEKYLVDERREEIHGNFQEGSKELHAGKLRFGDDLNKHKKSLAS